VVDIDDGKIIFDKGEIVRNGAALHIDHGIAVTSHASQAKTVDQVIVSVPVRAFSQANETQFYVSMSRARSAMYVRLPFEIYGSEGSMLVPDRNFFGGEPMVFERASLFG
jgi:hypothetical protein